MKIRRRFAIRISGLQQCLWIAKPSYVTSDYFSRVYGCDFEQAKYHLRQAKDNNYCILKIK